MILRFFNLFPILGLIFLLNNQSLAMQQKKETENWLLEQVGVYKLSNPSKLFGGISSIIVEKGGSEFILLSDKSNYFKGNASRDSKGKITTISISEAYPILSSKGEPLRERNFDSEALAKFQDGSFLISFESNDRIMYHSTLDSPGEFLPSHPNFEEFHYSKGIEALAVSNEGFVYAIPEAPQMGNSHIEALRFDGEKWEKSFLIDVADGYNITDALFAPDGTLLILERYYSWVGFTSRIRRFKLIDGKAEYLQTLLESRFREFDNLEGISMWLDKNQEYWLTVVSDDNFNIFQVTQLVEFKIKLK